MKLWNTLSTSQVSEVHWPVLYFNLHLFYIVFVSFLFSPFCFLFLERQCGIPTQKKKQKKKRQSTRKESVCKMWRKRCNHNDLRSTKGSRSVSSCQFLLPRHHFPQSENMRLHNNWVGGDVSGEVLSIWKYRSKVKIKWTDRPAWIVNLFRWLDFKDRQSKTTFGHYVEIEKYINRETHTHPIFIDVWQGSKLV